MTNNTAFSRGIKQKPGNNDNTLVSRSQVMVIYVVRNVMVMSEEESMKFSKEETIDEEGEKGDPQGQTFGRVLDLPTL